MDIWVRDDGQWKSADGIWARDDGQWKSAIEISVQESDNWEEPEPPGEAPSNLSVTWDDGNCGFQLSWTADPGNTQSIYRCSGSSCDPDPGGDGSLIDTVSAGTNSHLDTFPEPFSGTWNYMIVSTEGNSNSDGANAGACID